MSSNQQIDDKNQQQISDLELINLIFKSPKQTSNVVNSFKPAIIATIIFILLMLPITDKIISSCGCQNNMSIYGIKALIFIIVFYLFSNKNKE